MDKPVGDKVSQLTSPTTTLPEVTFRVLDDYVAPAGTVPQTVEYYRHVEKTAEEIDSQIEYDMDEEDFAWLELINEGRIKDGLESISEDLFELAMDRFEKESIFQCEFSAGEAGRTATVDEDALCSVCGSGETDTDNNILFCDLCNIGVHQACYGVPKVPAGPWACRRCTLSPSRAVDCCLCPNGHDGSAMKPTDDGRWAHVSCALWIPEVDFGCKSVREPVINVEKVAAARWKLLCVVCRRRGGGACLQCRRTSCYTAFHVSCAVRASLCIGTPSSDDDVAAFCDVHSSPTSSSDAQRRLNAARKTLSELQSNGPPVSVPVITTTGYSRIQQKLSLDKSDTFVSRLHCYWTLKRRARGGAPLLRSMLFSFAHLARQRLLLSSTDVSSQSQIRKDSPDGDNDDLKEMVVQLKCWKQLRQDLEKARLLLELIRKRERMKNEQVRVENQLTAVRLWPLMTLLSRTADELYRLDCDGLLSTDSETACQNSQQMFLSTVRKRIANHAYRSVDEFSSDVANLLDCVPEPPASLKDKVGSVLATVGKLATSADYEPDTGTHIAQSVAVPVKRTARKSDSRESGRMVSSAGVKVKKAKVVAAPTGTGRPRGRPKKIVTDQRVSAQLEHPVPGGSELSSRQRSGSTEGSKSETSSSVGGVNRRTAVLFGNKTPRRATPRLSTQSPAASPTTAESKTPRRPGRPPKHPPPAVVDASKSSEKMSEDKTAGEKHARQEQSDGDVVPKKRGRKKRSVVEPAGREFGLQWGEVIGSVTAEWSTVAQAAPSNTASRRTPQKESFRQYRVMHDSDVEGALKSDNDHQVASLSSSSSSSASSDNGESSSHSDNDDDDDASSSSSSSSRDNSSSTHNAERRRQSRAQDMTTQLKPLDLVWAKCKGYPWYPAQMIDPDMPRTGVVHNGATVDAPSDDVLKLRLKYHHEVFLVVFYDTKRTWRWLPRRKLDPLGVNTELDGIKLSANNKANVCAAVQRAYDRACRQTSSSTQHGDDTQPSVDTATEHDG